MFICRRYIILNISQHLTNGSTKGSKCKKTTKKQKKNFGLTKDKLRGEVEDKDGGYIIKWRGCWSSTIK